jgi:hypothetical protein
MKSKIRALTARAAMRRRCWHCFRIDRGTVSHTFVSCFVPQEYSGRPLGGKVDGGYRDIERPTQARRVIVDMLQSVCGRDVGKFAMLARQGLPERGAAPRRTTTVPRTDHG